MVNSSLKYLLLLMAFLEGLSSCQKQNTTPVEHHAEERVQNYGQTSFNFPPLSPEAEELVTDWPVFKDFKRISQNLWRIPVDDFKHRSNNLRLQTDSLMVTIPKSLESPIIRARLLVVSTRINLLNQETKKSVLDSTVIENRLLALHQSIRQFVLHINEKIEKDRLDKNGVNQTSLTP
jgi:hypothetical protein